MSSLASNADEVEKSNKKSSCEKFIKIRGHFYQNFDSLSDEEKNWVLEYLSGGKGIIPYKMIRSYEDLDAATQQEVFAKIEFYSSLRNEIILNEEYENVKKFFRLLRPQKLLNLNDIYNFQDPTILSEVFENRATKMMKKCPYNLRKCTSASSVSSCIHRYFLKVIISLPTKSEFVDVFKENFNWWIQLRQHHVGFWYHILLPKDYSGNRKKLPWRYLQKKKKKKIATTWTKDY